MKKANDPMRRSYRRSDFTRLERGKFHAEVVKGTSVVLLEPTVAGAFPSSPAVNKALSGLLALAHKTARLRRRTNRPRAKVARAG